MDNHPMEDRVDDFGQQSCTKLTHTLTTIVNLDPELAVRLSPTQ